MRSSNYFKNTGRANPVLHKYWLQGSNPQVLAAPGEGKRYVICDIVVIGELGGGDNGATTAAMDVAVFKEGDVTSANFLFYLQKGSHHFTPFALSENKGLRSEKEGDLTESWTVAVTYWIDSTE